MVEQASAALSGRLVGTTSSRLTVALATATTAATACTQTPAYTCQQAEECVQDDVSGRCEPNGFCSFPDPECESGFRFGRWSGPSSELCVEPSNSGATGIQIKAGAFHTCAINADGQVFCWGDNSVGQLGSDVGTEAATPTRVELAQKAVELVLGEGHSCAHLEDDSWWCWGDNSGYQMGVSSPSRLAEPREVTALDGMHDMSAAPTERSYEADGHGCGFDGDDDLWCWGRNTYGQLGDHTTERSSSPVPVESLPGWPWAVSTGYGFTCAILDDNSVACWGQNDDGQLGAGHKDETLDFQQVIGVSDVYELASGLNHTCSLDSNSDVYCWGDGHYRAVGGWDDVPTPVKLFAEAGAVRGGYGTACAIDWNDDLYCWGLGSHGTLGDLSVFKSGDPTLLASSIADVAIGRHHICAVTVDEEILCWGSVGHGLLGDGRVAHQLTLSDNLANPPAADMDLSKDGGCLRTDANQLLCWGKGDNDWLGVGGDLTWAAQPVAVDQQQTGPLIDLSVGPRNTCAVASNNQAWCWGDNTSNATGSSLTDDIESPAPVEGLPEPQSAPVIDIEAGEYFACAVVRPQAETGQVWCWGDNDDYRAGGSVDGEIIETATLVSGVDDVVDIEVSPGDDTGYTGESHVCALLGETPGARTISCWGANKVGQLGHGTLTDESLPAPLLTDPCDGNAEELALGGEFSCTRCLDGAVHCWGAGQVGQLGDGLATSGTAPVQVALQGAQATQISAATYHACALDADGQVWCWGANRSGQLGDGTRDGHSSPVRATVLDGLDAGDPIASVHAGAASRRGVFFTGSGTTCVRTQSGKLYCWGNFANGQLGVGDGIALETEPVGVQLP